MPNYLHKAGGTLEGGFPWSIGMVSTSTDSESAAEGVWSSGVAAMFTSASFHALLPTGTVLTYTSTSTASADFRQTTLTETTHSTPGTATQGLPFQAAEVVTWRTDRRTKDGHGRWYLPTIGVTALATDGFVLSTTAVGDIVTAVNAGLTVWVGSLNFQLLHRKNTMSGSLANTLTPIATGDVSDKLVIQRRRADKYVPARQDLTF